MYPRFEIWGQFSRNCLIDNLCLVTVDEVPPNSVRNLTGVREESGVVKLSWQPPEQAPDGEVAAYYQVWRADNPQMNGASLVAQYLTQLSFEDPEVAYTIERMTLKDYYYQVIAFDRVNNKSSETSNFVSCRGRFSPPEAPSDLQLIRNPDGSVQLLWQEPQVAEDGDRAVAYGVY